jgi:hypothetical protein
VRLPLEAQVLTGRSGRVAGLVAARGGGAGWCVGLCIGLHVGLHVGLHRLGLDGVLRVVRWFLFHRIIPRVFRK